MLSPGLPSMIARLLSFTDLRVAATFTAPLPDPASAQTRLGVDFVTFSYPPANRRARAILSYFRAEVQPSGERQETFANQPNSSNLATLNRYLRAECSRLAAHRATARNSRDGKYESWRQTGSFSLAESIEPCKFSIWLRMFATLAVEFTRSLAKMRCR